MRFILAALLACALGLPARAEMNMPGERGIAGEIASNSRAGQIVKGGARVESKCALGTGPVPIGSCVASGTVTVDPSLGPIQYLQDNGAFTLAAPANCFEGAVIIVVYMGATPAAPSLSGFNNTTQGVAFSITSTNTLTIWDVCPGGASSYAGIVINN
jgi:hypothetical protein